MADPDLQTQTPSHLITRLANTCRIQYSKLCGLQAICHQPYTVCQHDQWLLLESTRMAVRWPERSRSHKLSNSTCDKQRSAHLDASWPFSPSSCSTNAEDDSESATAMTIASSQDVMLEMAWSAKASFCNSTASHTTKLQVQPRLFVIKLTLNWRVGRAVL